MEKDAFLKKNKGTMPRASSPFPPHDSGDPT